MQHVNNPQINQFIAEAGGYFKGRLRIGDNVFGLIAAPKAQGEFRGVWLPQHKLVAGASSFFDSRANTIAMAEAGSDIGKKALAATIGGHEDWSIPARDALELLYRHSKPTKETNWIYRGDNPSSVPVGYAYSEESPEQCSDPLFQEGGIEAFEDGWYWSSTQASSHTAWGQYFDDGDQSATSRAPKAGCGSSA